MLDKEEFCRIIWMNIKRGFPNHAGAISSRADVAEQAQVAKDTKQALKVRGTHSHKTFHIARCRTPKYIGIAMMYSN